jgi:hypothetical protein
MEQGFNIAYALLVMHQRALVVPLRNRWGVQALGMPCLLALVMMAVWAGFSRDPYLWWWIGVWLLCFLVRRIEAVRLNLKGERIHSQYDGWPEGAICLGRTEKIAKLVVEPAIWAVFGFVLLQVYAEQGWSPYGLPYFFLAGVFSLPYVELVKQAVLQRRTQAMLDARVEQEQTTAEFRDKFGKF